MSQAAPGAFVDSESGTAHVSRHNTVAAAFLSGHSGTSAPSYATEGTIWRDSDTPSSTVHTLFYYDGTDNIGLLQIDKSNNYVAKFGVGIVPGSMAAGTMLHIKAGASGATADTAADDFVVDVPGAGGMSINGVVGSNVMIALGDGTNGTGSALMYWNGTTKIQRIGTNLAAGVTVLTTGANQEAVRLDGLVAHVGSHGGTVAATGITAGVKIYGAGNDDSHLVGNNTDVTHALTSGGSVTQATGDFLHVRKADATTGGTMLVATAETGIAEHSLAFYGYGNGVNNSFSNTCIGIVASYGSKHDGANAVATNNANVIIHSMGHVITGGSRRTLFALDVEGDVAWDGTNTTFDGEDDTGLLSETNAVIAAGDSPAADYDARLYELSKHKLFGYVGPRARARGARPLSVGSRQVRVLLGEAGQRANREAVTHAAIMRAFDFIKPGAGQVYFDAAVELSAGRNVGRLPPPISLN